MDQDAKGLFGGRGAIPDSNQIRPWQEGGLWTHSPSIHVGRGQCTFLEEKASIEVVDRELMWALVLQTSEGDAS